jgi:hypothetical protein
MAVKKGKGKTQKDRKPDATKGDAHATTDLVEELEAPRKPTYEELEAMWAASEAEKAKAQAREAKLTEWLSDAKKTKMDLKRKMEALMNSKDPTTILAKQTVASARGSAAPSGPPANTARQVSCHARHSPTPSAARLTGLSHAQPMQPGKLKPDPITASASANPGSGTFHGDAGMKGQIPAKTAGKVSSHAGKALVPSAERLTGSI